MTFNTSFKTTWILIVVIAFLVAWDIYARAYPGGTISEVLLTGARNHPIIPFLFGVVSGHLFFYQEVPSDRREP
jgi:hypothetical protein